MSAGHPSPAPRPALCFRPEQHLRRGSDIRHVREHGRRIDGGVFILWWLRHPPAGVQSGGAPARVGVVASSAAVGSAVCRNAAKRRLRELFRRHQALLPAGTDLVVIARAALNRLRFQAAESRFAEACRQIARSQDAAN